MTEADNRRWAEHLADIARKKLQDDGTGLLLSRVPSILKEADIDPEPIFNGSKIGWFLRKHGKPEIQILQHEANPALWILLPGEFKIDNLPSAYFPTLHRKGAKRAPRFKPGVWKAFVTQLADGRSRFIDLGDYPRYFDLEEGQLCESIEIEREFLRTDDLFMDNEIVVSRIELWAARHEIELRELIAPERREAFNSRNSGPKLGALLDILSSLDSEQRKRLSIPGDIILDLSK